MVLQVAMHAADIAVSPAITANPSGGTATVSEKALDDIFWQPVQ